MSQIIIYQNNEGGVCIVHPTQEALEQHTIFEVAAKDVPHGKPYKIIDATDVPSDRTFREAWTVDAADLTDGMGGAA